MKTVFHTNRNGSPTYFCTKRSCLFIAILENAVLSVISPKACAEILWKDTSREIEAVEILKMTSEDLHKQGIVDFVIPEPTGGAQTDVMEMTSRIKEYLVSEMQALNKLSYSRLVKQRHRKFRNIGQKRQ